MKKELKDVLKEVEKSVKQDEAYLVCEDPIYMVGKGNCNIQYIKLDSTLFKKRKPSIRILSGVSVVALSDGPPIVDKTIEYEYKDDRDEDFEEIGPWIKKLHKKLIK